MMLVRLESFPVAINSLRTKARNKITTRASRRADRVLDDEKVKELKESDNPAALFLRGRFEAEWKMASAHIATRDDSLLMTVFVGRLWKLLPALSVSH